MDKKLPKDERNLWSLVRGLYCVILLLFILFGVIIKPGGAGDMINSVTVWDHLHPASALALIGIVLIIAAMLTISGLTSKIIGPYLSDRTAPWIGWAGFISGILGVILLYA